MRAKIIIATLFILFILFIQHIVASFRVFLLVSEQFPQIPIKPLHFLTNQPKHEEFHFGQGIVADIFIPNHTPPNKALILAMGVRTNEKDKPTLLGFANNLARLGYVVMWPRLEALDKEIVKFEKPETFIKSFEYLEKRKEVDKNKISFVGFSVGSSIAIVAAEDPEINERVHSFIFFGGYYNIFDYLISLATSSMLVDGQKNHWIPAEDGVNHAKGILEKEGFTLDEFISEYDRLIYHTNPRYHKLLQFSPDQNLQNFKAPIFILHEKGDNFVPYIESVKLNDALSKIGKKPKTFHISNLFEHVQPKKGFSQELIKEFVGLFGFLHKVFLYL